MTDKSEPSKESSSSSEHPDDSHDNASTGDKYDLSGDFRGAPVNIKSTFASAGNNVRLQNLRDFTVQIRRVDTDAIVGTGIAVSTDGKIVTCAHVVEAAGLICETQTAQKLVWADLADLTPGPSPTGRGESLARAKAEAGRALQMSNEMGYHWGKVDAEEVLKMLKAE